MCVCVCMCLCLQLPEDLFPLLIGQVKEVEARSRQNLWCKG